MPNMYNTHSNKSTSKIENLSFLKENYIPEPNFTQIPNIFLDVISSRLSEAELRVAMTIMRQTFGWHTQWKDISLSFLMKSTGLEKKAVISGINGLVEKGFVEKKKTGKTGCEKSWYKLVVKSDKNVQKSHSQYLKKSENLEIKSRSNNFDQYPKDTGILKIPNKERDTLISKEIYEKNNTRKAATAPPSPIIPLFSYSWKNPKTGHLEKIENGITPEERSKLREAGVSETEEREISKEMASWAENSGGTVRFKNANIYKKMLEWNRKRELGKKEKAQVKKESILRGEEQKMYHDQNSQSGKQQSNIPDRDEQRQNDFKAYILQTKSNPKNQIISALIRPNGGCTRVELFKIDGKSLHSTINYNESNHKEKMGMWMKDLADELKNEKRN